MPSPSVSPRQLARRTEQDCQVERRQNKPTSLLPSSTALTKREGKRSAKAGLSPSSCPGLSDVQEAEGKTGLPSSHGKQNILRAV